ncbi:MAG: hypothetical protein ACJ8CR_24365, partial [Roseiflexaceae bacterium]
MTENAIEDARTARVEFIEYHRPGLLSGTYEIKVTQEVAGPGIGDTFTTARQFTVAGERFTLQPADIYAVFPPDGSLGEHSNVLPHIALSRSTLPWEHSADGSRTPWLALLLFYEDESLGGAIEKQAFLKDYAAADNEAAWNHLLDQRIGWLRPLPAQPEAALIVSKGSRTAASLGGDFAAAASRLDAILDRYRSPQVVTLGSLKAASAGAASWSGPPLDPNQNTDSDKVTVIDVEKRLLATIMPTADDLNLLTHVRRAEDAERRMIEDERAVIIGSRLPKKNGISVVHLVSIEGRYTSGSFDYRGAQDDTYIRLISLKSWRFACVDPKGNFIGLLTNLNRAPSTLRLPRNPDEAADGYLSPGYVPVPHRLRQAGRTVSWYRGPLITRASGGEVGLPAQTAGALVRYDPAIGMFDVSYAAAWELGRLLALQSKQLSVSLYNWKRANAQALRTAETWLLHPSWVGQDAAADSSQLPSGIVAWFDNLRLLRGVPFNYLMPDERMLPPESIRFFQVDPQWIEALVDGAWSLGFAGVAEA